VVAGTDERPVEMTCGACMNSFTLTPKIIKVEIDCPGCERTLRIRPRPGTRELKCPACESGFNVTF
jgi:transposase-like protein